MTHDDHDSFESLLRPRAEADAATTDASPGRSWRAALPGATIALTLLGVGALVTAFTASAFAPASEGAAADAASAAPAASASSAATRAPSPSATPSATASGAPRTADVSVAELADPAWVARIAAAATIPERALAAYAGASLATARSHPGCGLGWNTLAAIGLVETEHGTMHGAEIGPDGVASPSIVGVALDGDGTLQVRDTDGGALDGDTVWDRAVGPLQFIPDTWRQYAQDGDHDGVTDIHDVDDAALAAAVYLCVAGGDLTQPANWIAAVEAYNPSVEYNNRVADAANHYATLG